MLVLLRGCLHILAIWTVVIICSSEKDIPFPPLVVEMVVITEHRPEGVRCVITHQSN